MNETNNAKRQIEEMRQYYEARAPWHDQYMSYESNMRMEEQLKSIIEAFKEIILGRKVLEIACGTGNWTEVLAKRAAFVTAIDSSPAALAIAQPKLSIHKNVTLMQGDAYDLNSIKDTFEVLFSAHWLSHIPKSILPEFLDSALEKLLPGSKAIFIDMSFNEYFRKEPNYYDEDNNRISLRTLPDGSEFRVVKNFPSESELLPILANYSGVVSYHEFPSLNQWMVILEKA